jgi:intracellular sulfur oxidation DsrE/DsrF family protein
MSSPTHDEIRAHAYVDDELDPDERAELLEELVRNPVRSREVAELGELKELVRIAFERLPGMPQRHAAAPRRSIRAGVRRVLGGALAAMLLVAAFGAGWLAHAGNGALDEHLAALGGVRLTASQAKVPGVLLHLVSFEGRDVNATLQRAGDLLERYRDSGLKVEVVVNGMALQFLSADFFPYSDEFAQLMKRYPNLRIVACGATLNALDTRGQSLRLLKGVDVAPSAVEEVVKRLHQGWVYVEA